MIKTPQNNFFETFPSYLDSNTRISNMKPAALGVACREALEVFSANETLRLQKRVAELEMANEILRNDVMMWEHHFHRSRTYSTWTQPVCPYNLDVFGP